MPMKDSENLGLWYTLGPASLGKERELFLNGATGVRLTFGFGTTALQYERAVQIKELASQLKQQCLIIADLNGEKYRLGSFEGEATIQVAARTKIHLVFADKATPFGERVVLPIPNKQFFSYLRKETIITIGDGGANLLITELGDNEAYAEMMADGVINHCRGLNIREGDFDPCSLTEKDLRDLEHILSVPEYDIVALSFVSSEADVLKARQLASKASSNIQILAKIETALGVKNIEAICQAADIVMAARGDLGLAIPWIELPRAVQQIASTANSTATPWILATQIMEGLDRFSIPTRAEICDLAHWLQEGCSGVLLSTETGFGSRPLDAVAYTSRMMNRWGSSRRNNHE